MSAKTRVSPLERITLELEQAGVPADAPLLVGFSGGPDSVALALWLMARGHARLTLLHMDHGLRSESAREVEWVRAFAGRHGLETLCERVDVAALAREKRLGIEEAGRLVRHDFFGRAARALGIPRVCLGHQADDQVETFLFRLLRGSGSTGLGGISRRASRTTEGFPYELLRPMLGVWRSEILAFLIGNGHAFLEDPSNADPHWARNRIRHELLPSMEGAARRPVRGALWRTAEMLREESAFLEGIAAPIAAEEALVVATVRALHRAVQTRVVLLWLRRHGVPDAGHDAVERVVRLVYAVRPSKVNLPGDGHAVRRKGKIHFLKPGSVP